jgi:hypothetical protein
MGPVRLIERGFGIRANFLQQGPPVSRGEDFDRIAGRAEKACNLEPCQRPDRIQQ